MPKKFFRGDPRSHFYALPGSQEFCDILDLLMSALTDQTHPPQITKRSKGITIIYRVEDVPVTIYLQISGMEIIGLSDKRNAVDLSYDILRAKKPPEQFSGTKQGVVVLTYLNRNPATIHLFITQAEISGVYFFDI